MSITWKSLAVAGLLAAAAGTAHAGAIAANPNPLSFDAGFGKITVTGQISGLALAQSNATHAYPGDSSAGIDLDNGMVAIAKTDGMFQFYVQAGLYSFPTVGYPYDKASDQVSGGLGLVPVAYGKLQLSDTFSISAGKLPTLVGAELAFSPQNINIERGLLWWQEPISSRGVQATYAKGPLSVSVSWNDGYYSDIWNTGSALVSYAIDSANTIAFDASLTSDSKATLGHQIYNLMYTYTSGNWTVGPYAQYEAYDHSSGSEYGLGVLASYQATPEWSLNGRVEYEKADQAGGLVFGPKADAFSATFTPTWQKGIFFARAEVSYVSLGSNTLLGYGTAFDKSSQVRGLFETGIVF